MGLITPEMFDRYGADLYGMQITSEGILTEKFLNEQIETLRDFPETPDTLLFNGTYDEYLKALKELEK